MSLTLVSFTLAASYHPSLLSADSRVIFLSLWFGLHFLAHLNIILVVFRMRCKRTWILFHALFS